MAALQNWTVSGLNVRIAYLYCNLDEEIYMETMLRERGREKARGRPQSTWYNILKTSRTLAPRENEMGRGKTDLREGKNRI
jgi:hypothetical protein